MISRAEYKRNTDYVDKKRHFGSLEQMVETYQFTAEQHHEVAAYCRAKKVQFLSSCFSPEEVDLLDSLDVPAFKIASMDINHLKLLEYAGSKQRPLILSTGMASLAEVERAVETVRSTGNDRIALLHCVSIYPAPAETVHLRNIATLRTLFDVPVGFSDHTMGTAIPLAAIAAGACIIEKHFTLDRDMEGWDHWISADPGELEVIVREGRNVYAAMGSSQRHVTKEELAKRIKFRRRIVLRRAMKAGDAISIDNLDFKRPGNGIHPDEYPYVIGRTVNRDTDPDHELEWDDIS